LLFSKRQTSKSNLNKKPWHNGLAPG